MTQKERIKANKAAAEARMLQSKEWQEVMKLDTKIKQLIHDGKRKEARPLLKEQARLQAAADAHKRRV